MANITPTVPAADKKRVRLIRGWNNRPAGFVFDEFAGAADSLVRFRNAEYAPDEPLTTNERKAQEQAAAIEAEKSAAEEFARRKASANVLRGQG